MKIELITIEEHKNLLAIFTDFPNLTLQNKGYETLIKSQLTAEDTKKIEEVETLLKKTVKGFSSFTNFRLNQAGETQIRLQYNYNYDGGIPFIGVGYILVDELLNGFI